MVVSTALLDLWSQLIAGLEGHHAIDLVLLSEVLEIIITCRHATNKHVVIDPV